MFIGDNTLPIVYPSNLLIVLAFLSHFPSLFLPLLLFFSTISAISAGSAEKHVIRTSAFLSNVKCFSITVVSTAAAAMHAVVLSV